MSIKKGKELPKKSLTKQKVAIQSSNTSILKDYILKTTFYNAKIHTIIYISNLFSINYVKELKIYFN